MAVIPPALNLTLAEVASRAAQENPAIWENDNGKLRLKFDTIAIFWHPEEKKMCLQYLLNGVAHLTTPIPGMSRIKGEVVISDLKGSVGMDLKL